ncbi:hypothetical protein Lsai_0756 [Legionella sainthelensi]|uniref:Uncharacterized protein n=1 Tax=Legionella sainthelensi TaxID=28087 RepID=A0A0W0YPX1_9GAMM|nr:hypothetical protein [Legionella sainthelensi]KTD58956.1 hypothetical protein Lsai_0756 [Legionella sainthelensi]VEH30335.1 Uncharacterised protein [Legionella sainthelensi]
MMDVIYLGIVALFVSQNRGFEQTQPRLITPLHIISFGINNFLIDVSSMRYQYEAYEEANLS